jgi:hypothetical protein
MENRRFVRVDAVSMKVTFAGASNVEPRSVTAGPSIIHIQRAAATRRGS